MAASKVSVFFKDGDCRLVEELNMDEITSCELTDSRNRFGQVMNGCPHSCRQSLSYHQSPCFLHRSPRDSWQVSYERPPVGPDRMALLLSNISFHSKPWIGSPFSMSPIWCLACSLRASYWIEHPCLRNSHGPRKRVWWSRISYAEISAVIQAIGHEQIKPCSCVPPWWNWGWNATACPCQWVRCHPKHR